MKTLLVLLVLLMVTPCYADDDDDDDSGNYVTDLIDNALNVPNNPPSRTGIYGYDGPDATVQHQCPVKTWTINRDHDLLICTQHPDCTISCI